VLEHQCEIGIVEMWADVAGYEGRYQVSTLGRIKSLARTRKGKSDCLVPVAERIMKVHIKKNNGRQRPYAEICLRNGSSRETLGKQKLVHRLVADAFIKKLEKGEQVDHINGKHNDNRVENLRVLKTIEHARLHPIIVNPLKHDSHNGRFLPRNL
jgi:NUMOD4 motif/HNH endonuclease